LTVFSPAFGLLSMRYRRLLASCVGLGRLGVAPGTWGSVPAVAVFVVARSVIDSGPAVVLVMAALAAAASICCLVAAPTVVALTGQKDPREVVLDELAGQAVALLPAGLLPASQAWTAAILAFALFRLFDIAKPWPIRKLETLRGGWGILADDLAAGVCAAVVLILLAGLGVVDYGAGVLFSKTALNPAMAALLGAVQGLTEFLPVSSSGHLVLFETFFGLNPEKPEMLLFDLATHVGTVVAIFVVFRKSIAAFFGNLMQFRRYGVTPGQIYRRSPSVRFLSLALLATIVTGILGMVFKDYFTAVRGRPAVVAAMWVITGTLLLAADLRGKTRLGLRQFGPLAAIIVGVAQAAAVTPGISRSGATICVAILIGLHRRWAVEFSFLLAIPAILGATAIETVTEFARLTSGSLPAASFVTGAAVAALVGVIALKLLVRTARRAQFKYFAFYCYLLAVVVLIYLTKPL